MKKAILMIAVLLLVGSFVFAQDASVKVGAWGRGIFIPVNGSFNTMTGVSWGSAPRVGLTISGTSPNVGFQADFNVDWNQSVTDTDTDTDGVGGLNIATATGGSQGAQVNLGDQQKIWVKPIDMVTIQIGRILDETLRGNAGNWGGNGYISYGGMKGDDAIFQRVNAKNIEVSVKPIEGLYVYGALGGIIGSPADVQETLITGQYGAGYTIAGIGTARAQFLGGTTDNGQINAAFKLTAVDKLTIDVGGYIPLALTSTATTSQYGNAAIDVAYSLDALTLNAMSFVSIPKTGDVPFEVGAGANYKLTDDGVTVFGDVRYQNEADSTVAGGTIGGTVGIQKGFSNGKLGIAFQVTNGTLGGAAALDAKVNANDLVWALPVKFEFSF